MLPTADLQSAICLTTRQNSKAVNDWACKGISSAHLHPNGELVQGFYVRGDSTTSIKLLSDAYFLALLCGIVINLLVS